MVTPVLNIETTVRATPREQLPALKTERPFALSHRCL
jgi:hypothetical protein